jgi:hypothetical protein
MSDLHSVQTPKPEQEVLMVKVHSYYPARLQTSLDFRRSGISVRPLEREGARFELRYKDLRASHVATC